MTTAKYLWLDLETTGFDPDNDRVLECAALVTGGELEPIGGTVDTVLRCPASAVAEADAVVREMHTDNGLWQECAASMVSPEQLDSMLVALIGSVQWADKPVLAGATVHFDRGFLRRWCPRTEALLGHRHLDVSSLKMAVVDATGATFAKARAHRAMADVRESLEQARDVYALLATPAVAELVPLLAEPLPSTTAFEPVLTIETTGGPIGEIAPGTFESLGAIVNDPAITVTIGDAGEPVPAKKPKKSKDAEPKDPAA
jgi:oligoribonuclease